MQNKNQMFNGSNSEPNESVNCFTSDEDSLSDASHGDGDDDSGPELRTVNFTQSYDDHLAHTKTSSFIDLPSRIVGTEYRCVFKEKKGIREVVDLMNLSQVDIICSRAWIIFDIIRKNALLNEMKVGVAYVSSVYIAYMDFDDEKKKYDISSFAKNNCIKFHRLRKALELIHPSIPFIFSNQDPAHHMTHIINAIRPSLSMEMRNQVADTASNLLARFRKDMICSGRQPGVVCAAAIKMAADYLKIKDKWVDEKYLASILKKHYHTLKKRIKEGNDTPLHNSLLQHEPLNMSELLKEKPALPPCMKKPKFKKIKNKEDNATAVERVMNCMENIDINLHSIVHETDDSADDDSIGDVDADDVLQMIELELLPNVNIEVDDHLEQMIEETVDKPLKRRKPKSLIPKGYENDLSILDSIIPYDLLMVNKSIPKPWTPELKENYKKIEKLYDKEARKDNQIIEGGTKTTFEEKQEKLREMVLKVLPEMAKIDPTLPSVSNWLLFQ